MPNEPQQLELPMPYPEHGGDMPLLPARMVNEYQYCPRLAYLEWVQGEWAASADTVQGAHAHRRVDQAAKDFPEAGGLASDERLHGRSVTLSSERLGLIAKLDLIEAEDGRVTPVDYKRGKRPHVARGAYDPERVQPCLQDLMKRDIPVSWHSYGGWFFGHTIGTGHKNVELRTAQYRASFDPHLCLTVARGLVRAKIQNSRTLLRRNWRAEAPPDEWLAQLKALADKALRAADAQQLLGLEGAAAAVYFGAFDQLLKKPDDAEAMRFDFNTRNRRPPTDPVNALLSFAYALLVRTWTVALTAVGFDAYRGYYHQPRYGRPALALDLMEPFRPLIADSAVLQAINNGEVHPGDFITAAGSVALDEAGRKRFIAAFERRLDQEITHPLFGYKINYRRLFEIQARLFARYLLGELPEYPNFTTR